MKACVFHQRILVSLLTFFCTGLANFSISLMSVSVREYLQKPGKTKSRLPFAPE